MTAKRLAEAPLGTPILIWIPSTRLWWPGYRDGRNYFSNSHGRLNVPGDRFSPRARFWVPMLEPPKAP